MVRRLPYFTALLFALIVCRAAQASPVVLAEPTTLGGPMFVLVNAETINGTGNYLSDAVDLRAGAFFGAWYRCTSALGTPDIKIEWLESASTESTEFVTVGSAGAAAPLVSSLADETAHVLSIQPPPMRYARVKLTGNGSNPADSVCTFKVFKQ